MNKSTSAIVVALIGVVGSVIVALIGRSAPNQPVQKQALTENTQIPTNQAGRDLYQAKNIKIYQSSNVMQGLPREQKNITSPQKLSDGQNHKWNIENYQKVIDQFSNEIEDYFFQKDKKVIVLEFIDQNEQSTFLGQLIAEDISAKLTKIARGFKIQDRRDFLNALGEHKLISVSLGNPEKRKMIMEDLGIDAIITGTIFSFEKEFKGMSGWRRSTKGQMGAWPIDLSDNKTKMLAAAGLLGLALWYRNRKKK